MKNKYTFIALMFAFAISKAQTIPNADFENWTNHGNYETPDDWFTYNTIFAFSGVFTCEKGTPGAVGSAYLKLTTKEISPGNMFQGFAISSPSPLDNVTGFAFNSRPQNLTGKYQYLCKGNDSAGIIVNLLKWNATTMTNDIVAVGWMIKSAGAESNWTSFSIPLDYYSGDFPDTALIYLGSSIGYEPVLNDYLYIDDLKFTGNVASVENENVLNATLSPNPFSTQATITFKEPQLNTVIRITDIAGKEIKTQIVSGSQCILERGDMKEGVYFIQIKDLKNNVANKRIVVY